ncbi:amino acid permease [Fusarium pseudocircinatum]|uniref:Amino acid permease n=1 Tax=Fusarium pseudocircinatum TaxID=56676 RepID=A0A8H5KFK4_9HYPO|nr:amino acid permease [Fusarium pseudocircinatum]
MAENDIKIESTADNALQQCEAKPGSIHATENDCGEFRRSFSARQIHMISLGGQIGAGLFVSTGTNLARGGPASMLISFAIVSSYVFAMLHIMGKMTIGFPMSSNFINYAD